MSLDIGSLCSVLEKDVLVMSSIRSVVALLQREKVLEGGRHTGIEHLGVVFGITRRILRRTLMLWPSAAEELLEEALG